MAPHRGHHEVHLSQRSGWLRAAVLGSNDAIVSTASLMIGVAAADATRGSILVAGVAGLVAGALSMAAGEYVSVSSQRDAERADIAKERRELDERPENELLELTSIYVARGLDRELAEQVARQLTAHDAVRAHLRDELGLDPDALAHPLQAAWISAASFAVFASIPVLFLLLAPAEYRIAVLAAASLAALAALGAVGARLGGARLVPATVRVVAGGGLAMGVSAAVGHALGVSLG